MENNMNKGKMIDRRSFLKYTAAGAVTACGAACLVNYDKLLKMLGDTGGENALDAKAIFGKCGTCSQTLINILNREFDHPKLDEERATDPLAGGMLNKQYQCGMLWGSTLAAGLEASRRCSDRNEAMVSAMSASQSIVKSFVNRTQTTDCRDIVDVDISKTTEVAEFMIKSLPGGFANIVCMNIIQRWAPEAIKAAREGLNMKTALTQPASCASEVVKRMGGSEEEIIAVAGLAGGIGFSGGGCGALGAAMWKSSLDWCRKNPGKSGYENPKNDEIINAFVEEAGNDMTCGKICRKNFKSIEEHSEYINNDGCSGVIELLVNA